MPLLPGDFAPNFRCASSVNPKFNFDTVAGRYIVLSFFASSQIPMAERLLAQIAAHKDRFDVTNAMFFGVTADGDDVSKLVHEDPGRIFFYDIDLAVSNLFGIVSDPSGTGEQNYDCKTFVLDQSLRIIGIIGLGEDAVEHVRRVFSLINAMPPLAKLSDNAPVLIVPYVFEPDFCKELIRYYESKGGEESGFMRDVGGKTVRVSDHSHKRRMDCDIIDDGLIRDTQERIKRRIVPAIKQAYQFDVTRIERHIVACYDAAQGAHFRAHRDNTTLGTAHRRFAVTINLNSPDYEGGEIWFPEFSRKKYKAPSGAAIVFSCSLLHEVPAVTRGKRYAFLPFLYDDAAAKIRDANRKHVDLSGPSAGQPASCYATKESDARPAKLNAVDGSVGCGNPNGCQTCLSAPAYELGEDTADAASPRKITEKH